MRKYLPLTEEQELALEFPDACPTCADTPSLEGPFAPKWDGELGYYTWLCCGEVWVMDADVDGLSTVGRLGPCLVLGGRV